MIFIVLSSWPQATARVHSVHLMNCRTAHKRPSTLRPSHLTWAVSPPVGSYRLQPPSPFIIITQPETWYSFTIPRRVEGWVDLDTAGRVHTARAQGCKSQWCHKWVTCCHVSACLFTKVPQTTQAVAAVRCFVSKSVLVHEHLSNKICPQSQVLHCHVWHVSVWNMQLQ